MIMHVIKIVVLSCFVIACDNAEFDTGSVSSTSMLSVDDDSGAIVSLAKPAERIIALAPHIIENVYSAGAGDLLLASVDYADYPPAAKALPSVGGYNKFNIEAIAALRPDVVFVWQSGTPSHFLEKIRQLGIPVYLDEPTKVEDVAKALRNIGVLTGRESVAEKAARQHIERLRKIQVDQANKRQVSVFYQVWDDPLYTINGKQIISDVLNLCGGINIFADEPIKAPIVSIESLVSIDPMVIMTGSQSQSSDKALASWKKWPSMQAVKHGNLFVVNPDIVSRHTARILDGAELVCDKLDQARLNMD